MPTQEQAPQEQASPARLEAEHHHAPQERRYLILVIGIEEGLHTHLRLFAQPSMHSLSHGTHNAIQNRITTPHDDPELITGPQSARAVIQREAVAWAAGNTASTAKPAIAARALRTGRCGPRITNPRNE